MLKKDEIKVLKVLFTDLTRNLTIMDLSRELKQKYVQTYRTIFSLKKSNDIFLETIGNSKIVKLNLTKFNPNYVIAEIERLKEGLINKNLNLIHQKIMGVKENFVCILFGSQANNSSLKSDFDLLFVIPNEFNYELFERKVKRELTIYNCDIHIVTEESLLEMWSNPQKLTVGNELLKKHLVLYNAEHFLKMLKTHYVG